MALPTQDDAIHFATKRYLSGLDMDKLPSLDELKAGVLQATHEEFDLHNAGVSKSARWKMPASLDEYQVAMLIQTVEHVRCIYCGGKSSNPERDLLGIYQECGPDAGLYVTDYETISRMIREYNRNFKSSQIKEVVAILRESVPHVSRCQERDLIAVNNGIFDYKTKMLQGFSPDKVYLAKCRINYTLAPMLPVIHNDDGTDWDVESWLNELSDDPEIVQLIWEILGAIIRPFVSWGVPPGSTQRRAIMAREVYVLSCVTCAVPAHMPAFRFQILAKSLH